MAELMDRNVGFKYVAIRNWILEKIEKHHFKYGDKLPSENLLCHKFSISRQTVRNAIDELEKNGIVKRIKGSGTYVAKTLGEVRNKTVGVLLSYLNEYIFPSILQGIEGVLTAAGYGMDLGMTYNKLEAERRFLERMLEANVSGIIVEGTKTGLPNPNIPMYEELIRREIPLVFMHNYYSELESICPSVLLDDENCVKKLTSYMIEKGHRKIAGFFKYDDMQGQQRYRGYMKALIEAGIPFDEQMIGWFSTCTRDSLFQVDHSPLLENIESCSAIVCYNDQIASKMYTYFKERGIKVPADISMVGFDDSFSNPMSRIQLTTIKHPKSKIGEKTAELVMEMIREGMSVVPAEKYMMDASMVIRNSIKDLR